MKNLYTKLLAVQEEIKPIVKDEVNPHFKNRYFDINSLLAELKPILNSKGLVIMQPLISLPDGTPALETNIIDTEGGESLTKVTVLPTNQDPQKMGGIITYFRRYSLQSLFCLEAEDDDGNIASGHLTPRTKRDEPFADTDSPHYEPVVAIVHTDDGSQPEMNKCTKCGKACKAPFKICYTCKTAK